MSAYVRVRFQGHADPNPTTAILRVTSESERFLVGTEVNREGDEIKPRGADERMHVLDTDCIIKRTPLVFDNHYGWLVPA